MSDGDISYILIWFTASKACKDRSADQPLGSNSGLFILRLALVTPVFSPLPRGKLRFMPKYVYQGLTTGVTFELEQRITEAALTHHPETFEPVKRLIGRPAISFKGSGFYANDSKSSSEPKAAPAGDAKPGDAKPSEAKPGDAKPSESKAESSSPAANSDKSTTPTKEASSPAPAATPAPAKSAD